MAERIADNAEQLVDEMKRKARRRLVGAIVLALGAAIVLPLLLEKEPRPLGDDVSVQIPPVDESKFVNRLTGKSGESKALPKAETKASNPSPKAEAPVPAAPVASAGDAPAPKADVPAPKADAPAPKADVSTPKADAPAVKADVPTPKNDAKAAPSAESKSDAKPIANPVSAAPPPAATAATPASAPASASETAPAATVARAEGFVVQLAAFADDKGANSLANKLKKNGYAAYVQSVETSRGTLWRVRVGGYATRPEADAARATLKGEGYSGITVPAQ